MSGKMILRYEWKEEHYGNTEHSPDTIVEHVLEEPDLPQALESFKRFLAGAGYGVPEGDLDFVDDEPMKE